MYAITVQIEHIRRSGGIDWRSSRGVPTFYLDERVQGILTEDQAARVAAEIVDPFRIMRTSNAYTLHVTAVKL